MFSRTSTEHFVPLSLSLDSEVSVVFILQFRLLTLFHFGHTQSNVEALVFPVYQHMVVISNTWASSSSSDGKESSPSSPGVQFNPSNSGLPGGDMQLVRTCGPSVDSGMDSSNASTNEDRLDVPLSNPELNSSRDDISASVPLDENGHKYVGLINQAMTCYLNSLVQSLYMTPEFRNAIYKWEYRGNGKFGNCGEREARSIPYQIQKLFLLLQTSDVGSLETKDLTASFGWSSNEAYDQHDVQELCRLMFDALELKWRGTQNEKLIQNLYRGKMQDFVKCFKCGRENVRPDVFLDLPLAVKPFGAVEAFRSVEEALQAFITPELLDGSNQYFCENCNSKQDAHKGLRVTEFPYLLTIQLKRFDFDYNTMHRIKLNDRVTFPDVLDLNPFVYSPNVDVADFHKNETFSSGVNSETVVAGQQLNQTRVNQSLKRGEYVYELFSVMVHQGSAAGGHYFAHIKNMDQGLWYCFNDTRVDPVGPEEISKSFGGSYGGWSTSNTNAYMLMYRKISKANATFIRTSDLPTHIIELKTQWKEQEAEREKQRIYQLNLVNITVKLNMVCDNEALLSEPFVVDMPRSQVLYDIYNKSLRFFEEKFNSLSISSDNFSLRHRSRLVRVTSNRGLSINEALVSKAELAKTIEFLLVPGRPNNLMFLLDVWRPRGVPYPIFPPNGRTIRVARVDIAARLVNPSFHIYVNPELHTVIQVKHLIGSMFGDGQRAVVASRLILERDTQTDGLVSLDCPSKSFNDLLQQCFSRVPLVYCDCGSKGESMHVVEKDRMKPLNESIMFAILDRKKFSQIFLLELPPSDEVTRAQSMGDNYRGSIRIRTEEMVSPNISDVDEATDISYVTSCLTGLEGNIVKERLEGHSEETESSNNTSVPSMFTCSSELCSDIIELSAPSENLLQLDVDSRMLFGNFKRWLGEKLIIDPAQFVVVKHYKEDDRGYECNSKDNESVRHALENVLKLGIKLRPPLKEDEKLIRIVHFDLDEPNRENWKVLFECAASKQTTVKELMLQCINLYAEIYGQHLEFNQIRLREMPTFSQPMKAVLNPADTLDSRGAQWSNNIYFQIVIGEHLIGQPGVPVLVRRFRPSTVEVSSIQEVLVDPNAVSQMESLASSVSSLSGIPVERLGFTEVGSSWDKWPFALSRLAMLDGSVKFSRQPTYAPNEVIDRVGGRVIYYRDIAEVPKELSIEDRKQIQIKEYGQSMSTIARRKERPLRIQMSSLSEP